MKRIVCVFAVCLLLFACLPAMAENAATPLALAPIVLLEEAYNPFFAVPIPDSYSVAGVRCGLSADGEEYSLTLSTADPMNDVIAFMASVLPDAAIDTMQSAMNLMSRGDTDVEATYESLSVRFTITDLLYEDSEHTGDRFTLKMEAMLPPGDTYRALFDTNLQYPLFAKIDEIMPLSSPESYSMQIWPPDDRAEMFVSYAFADAPQLLDKLLAAYPDNYYSESDWLVWRIGAMQIVIPLKSAANGALGLLVNFPDPETSLLDYAADTTLATLGFEDNRAFAAQCAYQDNQAGVWISISKDAWDEAGTGTVRNALNFMTQESGAFILIVYDPETTAYAVTLEVDGEQTKYVYDASTARYINADGGDDLTDATRLAAAAFLGPGEQVDDVLALAVMLLDGYVAETFDCTVDALYAMEYE